MDISTSAPEPETSLATTRQTEPEVLAGISSGEGQPAGYAFDCTPAFDSRPLLVFGAVALSGLIVALLGGFGRRG